MTGAASGIGAGDRRAPARRRAATVLSRRRHRRRRTSHERRRPRRGAVERAGRRASSRSTDGSTAWSTPPAWPAVARCTWSIAPSGTACLDINLTGTFLVVQARGHADARAGHRSTASAGSLVTHRQRRGHRGHRRRQRLQRVEGRRRPAHEEHGHRLRPERHPGQRHLSRLHRHADDARRSSACRAWRRRGGDRRRAHAAALRPARARSPSAAAFLLSPDASFVTGQASPSTAATPPAATTVSPRCWGCLTSVSGVTKSLDSDASALARELAELGSDQKSKVFRMSWWSERMLDWAMARPGVQDAAVPLRRCVPGAGRTTQTSPATSPSTSTASPSPGCSTSASTSADHVPFGRRVEAARGPTQHHTHGRAVHRRRDAGRGGRRPASSSGARAAAATVDLSGEKTIVEAEADRYAARVAELLTVLADASQHWAPDDHLERTTSDRSRA